MKLLTKQFNNLINKSFFWPAMSVTWLFVFGGIYLYWKQKYFTFWGDELASVDYARQGFSEFVSGYWKLPDIFHPPLYYAILNGWQKLFQISFNNDYLYALLSIIFNFLTLLFLLVKVFKKNLIAGFVFVILSSVSSYFFTYNHMIRYYTMAAFFYIVAIFWFWDWLKTKNSRMFVKWFVASVILLYVDYPSYILLAISAVVFYLRCGHIGENFKNVKNIILFFALNTAFVLPLVYLNLFHGLSSKFVADGGGINILPSILKFILGLGLVPYHILIGEYFQPLITPILYLFVIFFFFTIYKTFLNHKSFEREVYKDYIIFIFINVVVGSLLLSTLIKTYPIFSFSRFVLPAAYLAIVLAASLLHNIRVGRLLLVSLVLINGFVLYNNLHKQYFINPIYFFPKQQAVDIVAKFSFPIAIGENGERKTEAGAYLMEKNFPGRSLYNLSDYHGKFMVLEEPLLRADSDVSVGVANKYSAKVVEFGGYDNIVGINKKFMKMAGLMSRDYKYYFFVLEK